MVMRSETSILKLLKKTTTTKESVDNKERNVNGIHESTKKNYRHFAYCRKNRIFFLFK